MAKISVSIAYISECAQHYQEMQVNAGVRICDVIEQSGFLALADLAWFVDWYYANQHSEPNHKTWYVGVYSVKKRLDTPVSAGDRVEIYRPLVYDPMTRRKSKSKPKKI